MRRQHNRNPIHGHHRQTIGKSSVWITRCSGKLRQKACRNLVFALRRTLGRRLPGNLVMPSRVFITAQVSLTASNQATDLSLLWRVIVKPANCRAISAPVKNGGVKKPLRTPKRRTNQSESRRAPWM